MPDFSTKPIQEKELIGAAVMASSILKFEVLVEELRDRIAVQDRINASMWQVLKAHADLFTELTDEVNRRKWLQKSILKAEREATRLRLPLWFWRSEPGLTLVEQVTKRAKLLREDRKSIDDAWDLCLEFQQDCVRECLPESEYRQIIRSVYEVQ